MRFKLSLFCFLIVFLTSFIKTSLLVNGCFIDMDDYAYNKLRKFSSPTQYLFNISKKSPMHNLQEINLKWK